MNNAKKIKLSIGYLIFLLPWQIAYSQAENKPSEWNGTALGFELPQQGLLGDMLGIRPILEENGFHYKLGYLSQMSNNLSGGYNSEARTAYIDQFSLTFTQSLEALTGIPDAEIQGNIVNRNHNDNLTMRRLQDPRVNYNDLSQESYGGQSITRLGWLTFSRSFLDRRVQWRIGMMNKVQDFDQIIPCDFQLLTQCGGKSANSMTWYNWNAHYWGTSLQYKLTPEVTLKVGVLEQNPRSTSRGHAWSWSTRGSKGFLLPMEAEWKTHINDLPGIYDFGVIFTNARQTDLSEGRSGGVGAADPQGYRGYDRTWFMYTGFNQQVTRHKGDAERGMSLSWSLGVADQRSNYVHYATSASMRYRGLFDARPNDWLGIGVSYIDLSNHYRRNQENLNDLNNVDDYGNPLYSPLVDHSLNAEIYYRFNVTPWFELQPGLQLWHRPGGISETQDAYVATLKTVVTF